MSLIISEVSAWLIIPLIYWVRWCNGLLQIFSISAYMWGSNICWGKGVWVIQRVVKILKCNVTYFFVTVVKQGKLFYCPHENTELFSLPVTSSAVAFLLITLNSDWNCVPLFLLSYIGVFTCIIWLLISHLPVKPPNHCGFRTTTTIN